MSASKETWRPQGSPLHFSHHKKRNRAPETWRPQGFEVSPFECVSQTYRHAVTTFQSSQEAEQSTRNLAAPRVATIGVNFSIELPQPRAESPPDFLAIKALPAAPSRPRPYGPSDDSS